jgi:hypothetical protein
MLTTFPKLSATLTGAIIRDPKAKVDSDFNIVGNFSVPSSVVGKLSEYLDNKDRLTKLRAKDAIAFDEFIEFRNMLRLFGKQVRPTFQTESGSLKLMYAPSIYLATDAIKEEIGECDFVIKFGDVSLPLIWDSEKEIWIAKNGNNFASLVFGDDKIPSKEGELKIAIARCRINGSEKTFDSFTARIGCKRDEKNRKKDAFSSSDIKFALENGNVTELRKMLSTPPSGGNGWTYTFDNDKFQFGRYPVVSLVKEKRTSNDKSWFNYIIVVVDVDGTETRVRLESKDQTIWNTLSNFYPWVDEDGKVHNEKPDEDDFLASFGDAVDYSIVYYGKTAYKRKTDSGQYIDAFKVSIKFQESNVRKFVPLSTSELNNMGGGSTVDMSSPVTTKSFTKGVDDLLENDADEVLDGF